MKINPVDSCKDNHSDHGHLQFFRILYLFVRLSFTYDLIISWYCCDLWMLQGSISCDSKLILSRMSSRCLADVQLKLNGDSGDVQGRQLRRFTVGGYQGQTGEHADLWSLASRWVSDRYYAQFPSKLIYRNFRFHILL